MEDEDYYPPDDDDPTDDDLDGLRERVERLEGTATGGSSDGGAVFFYFFGTCLAMILSWSRNASILYCIGHGLASWVYVIYFVLTRGPQ